MKKMLFTRFKTIAFVSTALFLSAPVFGQQASYTVKKGDTLYSIAKNSNVKLDDIVKLNNLADPTKIRIGQVLKLPTNQPQASTPNKAPATAPKTPVATAAVAPTPTTQATPTAPIPSKKPTEFKTQTAAVAPTPTAPTTQATPQKPATAQTTTKKPGAPETIAPGSTASNEGISLAWPISGKVLVRYGEKGVGGAASQGITIQAKEGQKVKAAGPGIVKFAAKGPEKYGNIVIIQHTDAQGALTNWVSLYGHLEELNVRPNDRLVKGQAFAVVQTVKNGSEKLFFQVRHNSAITDPMRYLK